MTISFIITRRTNMCACVCMLTSKTSIWIHGYMF
jgi:hypothetical protein